MFAGDLAFAGGRPDSCSRARSRVSGAHWRSMRELGPGGARARPRSGLPRLRRSGDCSTRWRRTSAMWPRSRGRVARGRAEPARGGAEAPGQALPRPGRERAVHRESAPGVRRTVGRSRSRSDHRAGGLAGHGHLPRRPRSRATHDASPGPPPRHYRATIDRCAGTDGRGRWHRPLCARCLINDDQIRPRQSNDT